MIPWWYEVGQLLTIVFLVQWVLRNDDARSPWAAAFAVAFCAACWPVFYTGAVFIAITNSIVKTFNSGGKN